MQIEERTISKVGGSSLMVTLPKGWCRFYGLQAGSKVLITTNGKLTIEAKPILRTTSETGDSKK